MAALFHGGLGGFRLVEIIGGVDDRADVAGGDERPELCLDGGADFGFLLSRAGAQGRSGEDEALHHQIDEVELDLRPLEVGDVADAAIGAGRGDVLLDIVAALEWVKSEIVNFGGDPNPNPNIMF